MRALHMGLARAPSEDALGVGRTARGWRRASPGPRAPGAGCSSTGGGPWPAGHVSGCTARKQRGGKPATKARVTLVLINVLNIGLSPLAAVSPKG